MKAIALVFSARKKGNCHDFARFMLGKMEKDGVETELVNLCDYNIKLCQNCDYECLARINPNTGHKEYTECPVRDDVENIWRKVWDADIFLMFVPTYGGVPPAIYVSFTQRYQSLWRRAPPKEKMQKKVIGAVVLASPDGASEKRGVCRGYLHCRKSSIPPRLGSFDPSVLLPTPLAIFGEVFHVRTAEVGDSGLALVMKRKFTQQPLPIHK